MTDADLLAALALARAVKEAVSSPSIVPDLADEVTDLVFEIRCQRAELDARQGRMRRMLIEIGQWQATARVEAQCGDDASGRADVLHRAIVAAHGAILVNDSSVAGSILAAVLREATP